MTSCLRQPGIPKFLACKFTILTLGLLFLTGGKVIAQVANVTDVEATPVPGAGHDYLGTLNEIVNPANGSLSIRIQVPLPKGRGLTVPFSFAYDSNGATSNPGQPMVRNPFYSKGWSYTVPWMSVYRNFVNAAPQGDPGDPEKCYYYNAYVFSDSAGTRHSFPNLSYASPATQDGCDFWGYYSNPSDSDASFSVNGGTVQDADGTTYSFGPEGGLLGFIEDRNGNVVSYSSTGGGILTVTDAAGRSVIATNGFGATGNTVAVSGLPNPYKLTWGGGDSWSYSNNAALVYYVSQGVPCQGSPPSASSTSVSNLSTITLPNGENYGFTYDPTYGTINEIIYPSGAWVKYTWGMNSQSESYNTVQTNGHGSCGFRFDNPAIKTRQVSYDGSTVAEEQDFTYSTYWTDNNNDATAAQWTAKSTTVTTYDEVRSPSKALSSVTTYSYTPFQIPDVTYTTSDTSALVPVESQIVYSDWNGKRLQTVYKKWYNQYLIKSEQTVLPNGTASQINYTYQPVSAYTPYGVLTEQDEYDYGQTTASRKTITNYQSFPAGPSGATINDRPCQTIVEDGSNRSYSETDYFYDGGSTGTKCGIAGTAATASVSNLTSHDETNYGPTSIAPRGNLTQENRVLGAGTSPSTTYTYDEAGQVLTQIDPCGAGTCSDMTGTNHTTAYQYTDSYSSGAPPANTMSNAYLTKVTDAKGFTTNYSYSYNDGQLTSATDENNQTTSYKYNTPPSGCGLPDGLDRLSEVDFPDRGRTTYCYSDAGAAPSISVSQLLNTSNVWKTDLSVMDGFGRVLHSELTSDPYGTDTSDTSYDGSGKVYTKSNPHRSSSSTTDGTSTFYYDALGRQVQVTEQDGYLMQSCYNGVASQPAVTNCSSHLGTVSSGAWVDSTDENHNHWQRTSDALGRLTEVMEPNGAAASPTMETDYAYDVLDNLLTVNQKGNSGDVARRRSFTYDSLSRLLTSSNPETGTLSYSYDANGNVLAKTDARNLTTSFTYDALNRVTTKTAPGVNYGYYYDAPEAGYPFPTTNAIGRLTEASNHVNASEQYSYDAMGRVVWEANDLPDSCCSTTANPVSGIYDLAGNMTSLTYPDGRTLSRSFDAAGRLNGVNYTEWNATFISPVQPYLAVPGALSVAGYDPASHLVSAALGAATLFAAGYNNREQLSSLSYTNASNSSKIWARQYAWAPSGNLQSTADAAGGTRQFTYDTLNRLATAKDTTGGSGLNQACSYDGFGNIKGSCVSLSLSQTYAVNNELMGWNYDGAGNLLSDTYGNVYTYDAEGQNTGARLSSGGSVSYVYDADGQRIEKVYGSAVTDTIFFGGQPIARYSGGAWTDLVYGAAGLLAEVPGSQAGVPSYRLTDHLGSVVATVPSSGAIVDYAPFGQIISGAIPDPYKFTGKERDTESGLDYFGARYYASNMGRMMSPDPGNIGANPANPQSWNMYSYSLNNPLTMTDPTGLYVCADGSKCDSANDKAFAAGLTAARDAANQLTGDDKTAALRAVNSYGAQGVDNGVKVGFDSKVDGGLTQVSGIANGNKSADNPTGQNINVTFNPNGAGDASLVGHEGSHVADGSDWVASGFSASKDPTNHQTEMDANHVQFNIANVMSAMKYDVAHGGSYTNSLYGGSVSWKNGATFKMITPDLSRVISQQEGAKDNQPAFTKGSVLKP